MSDFKFKVKKHVTLPLLKMEADKPCFVTILEPIYKAKAIAPGRKAADGKPQMEPPELMNVTNLENGHEYQMIVNTVLGSNLRDAYPNDTYVGKSFLLERRQIAGKRYASFDITEIELATEAPATPAKKSAK